MPTPCKTCSEIEASCAKHPFIPPSGTAKTGVYICPCGKKWYQSNTRSHTWKSITEVPAEQAADWDKRESDPFDGVTDRRHRSTVFSFPKGTENSSEWPGSRAPKEVPGFVPKGRRSFS